MTFGCRDMHAVPHVFVWLFFCFPLLAMYDLFLLVLLTPLVASWMLPSFFCPSWKRVRGSWS